LPGRSIVAVDGVDGAGKTVFANSLARRLEVLGRPVIRAGIDGFHNPRSVRYRRGKDSPEGFFLDSFNYDSLKKDLWRRSARAPLPFKQSLPMSHNEDYQHDDQEKSQAIRPNEPTAAA
jgi:uridine kinase